MNHKLLGKFMTSFIFVLLLSFISHDVFASEGKNTSAESEVITPQITTSVEEVQSLSKYASTTKPYTDIDKAVSYIIKEAKSYKSTVKFKYNNYTNSFLNSLSKKLDNALLKKGNDYLHGTISSWEISVEYMGKKADVKVKLKYIGTKKQEEYVTKEVKKIAKSLKKPGMTDLDKVLAVNQYIVNKAVYTEKTKTSPHHAYTLLKDGKGVCQAYALLAYRLLTEMGVEARYVVGIGVTEDGSEDHAWNSVKINGVWYHLDTTWNDIWEPKYKYNSFEYFLVTSAQLRKDHIWDESKFPVAKNKKYSYFHKLDMAVEHNGYVYYNNIKNDYLYELNTRTGKSKLIAKKPVYTFYVSKGVLYYYVGNAKKSYKVPNAVYAPKKATAIKASNVKVTNNYGKSDVITFKNLKTNATYTIYKDSKKKKKIDSFKAKSSKATRKIKQLGSSASSIYITVKTSGHSESNVTKVSYKAEKLPALAAQNVSITNKVESDTIAFKGLTKGFTYTVYSDSALKNKLTSFTATGATKTVTVDQVGEEAGAVYVVVSKKGYISSSKTKVNFAAQAE